MVPDFADVSTFLLLNQQKQRNLVLMERCLKKVVKWCLEHEIYMELLKNTLNLMIFGTKKNLAHLALGKIWVKISWWRHHRRKSENHQKMMMTIFNLLEILQWCVFYYHKTTLKKSTLYQFPNKKDTVLYFWPKCIENIGKSGHIPNKSPVTFDRGVQMTWNFAKRC